MALTHQRNQKKSEQNTLKCTLYFSFLLELKKKTKKNLKKKLKENFPI